MHSQGQKYPSILNFYKIVLDYLKFTNNKQEIFVSAFFLSTKFFGFKIVELSRKSWYPVAKSLAAGILVLLI